MRPEFFVMICIILAVFAAAVVIIPLNQQTEKTVQKAAVAGSWYPNDRVVLEEIVKKDISETEKIDLNGTVKAVIVPHAGYEYSGKIAGAAFRQTGIYENVFLIGPSHYYPVDEIAVINATSYETPMGEINISQIEKEMLKDGAVYMQDAFSKEHSLEAQIPFIQVSSPGSKLVPMLAGGIEPEKLKNILEKYLGEKDLVVVSADLSHYHSDSEARQLDKFTINKIMNLDPAGVMSAEIDAQNAVASLLKLAKARQWKPYLLKYSNSGEATGDKSSVVGYAAFAFVLDRTVSRDDQEFLLNLSREVLDNYTRDKKIISVDENEVPPKLREAKGCFVTLNKDGSLRGCIGHIEPQEELYKCVIDNTINAASRDTRFSPVREEELGSIKIDISVLTKPEQLAFKSGSDLLSRLTEKDGVVLKQPLKESTYLPQVWKMIPDKEEFLASLCLKGGMPEGCWNSSQTEVYTYQDFAFSES